MIGPLAARRVLGTMAVAGAPVAPSGPTVYFRDLFDGAAGTISGRTPAVGGAWSVDSGDVRTDGADLCYSYAAGIGTAAATSDAYTTFEWTHKCDGSANDRFFTIGWALDADNRWIFSYNRGSATNRCTILERSGGVNEIQASSGSGPTVPAGDYLCRVTVTGSTVQYIFAVGTIYETTLSYGGFAAKGARLGVWASTSTTAAARGYRGPMEATS